VWGKCRVGEIPTHGSIGRGLETDPRNGYTGTKLETAETAKPEPTGHRASPRPPPPRTAFHPWDEGRTRRTLVTAHQKDQT
jgi:hypothetical protein